MDRISFSLTQPKIYFGNHLLKNIFLLFVLAFGLTSCSNPEIENINPEETVFVDVRTPEEFSSGSVDNAINIPVDELPDRISELQSDKQIVVFCRSGSRSSRAKSILEDAGFKKVINGGGVNDLQQQLSKKKG